MKENYKYTKAPSVIWRIADLTSSEQIMLHTLVYLVKEDNTEINQGLLGYILNKSQSRISQMITSLKDKGFISIEHAYKTINKYTINWDKIASYSSSSDYFQNSENKAINPQDSINIPQEEYNAPESPKMAINKDFDNTIEEPQMQEEKFEITEKNIYEIMIDNNAKLADDFINKYKIAAYTPFLHLSIMKNLKSQGYPIDEEKYKNFKQEWDNMWIEFQQEMGDIDIEDIKQRVVERYAPRYKKDVIKFNEMQKRKAS